MVTVFNDRDLTCWEGNPRYWSVRDGVLTRVTDCTLKATDSSFEPEVVPLKRRTPRNVITLNAAPADGISVTDREVMQHLGISQERWKNSACTADRNPFVHKPKALRREAMAAAAAISVAGSATTSLTNPGETTGFASGSRLGSTLIVWSGQKENSFLLRQRSERTPPTTAGLCKTQTDSDRSDRLEPPRAVPGV
jgi:hypothetical protein